MTNKVYYQKALYIGHLLGEDPEDVYDILLGNITEPKELVNSVESESREYDRKKERGLREE